MNFLNKKITDNKKVSLKKLHKDIFNPKLLWFINIAIFVALFLINLFIGGVLFKKIYFEEYKNISNTESVADKINITGLKNAVDKRESFINKEVVLSEDPS